MCWQCEGNVDLDNESCPYCGVHLDNAPIPGTVPDTTSATTSSFPKAPYPSKVEEPVSLQQEENGETSKTSEEEEATSELFPRSLLTLLALLTGSVLVVFSLLLFFFSDSEGLFTLAWKGTYWYYYTLIGIPLLYLGWKSLTNLGE